MSLPGGCTLVLMGNNGVPVVVNFPFAGEEPVQGLKFASDGRGRIHAFWLDSDGRVIYSWVAAGRFGESSSWAGTQVIAASALTLEVISDGLGEVHLAYIRPLQTIENLAGVYYRRTANSGDSWLPAVNLYQSPYFRSLTQGSASVDIAASVIDEDVHVYVTWDNRFLKRAFITKSDDGGVNWGEVQELVGPENIQGMGTPLNVQISADNDNILVLYQVGESQSQCTQYSQWSENGGSLWSTPVNILDDYRVCPKTSEIIAQSDGQFIVLFDILEDLIFLAWNGIEWSEPQNQVQLSAFQNPDTFDSVIYRCRRVTIDRDSFLIVGCDQGVGGDIWFSSAPLGLIQDWFRSPTGWSPLETVASTSGQISTLSTADGQEDENHIFWVERTASEIDDTIAIQYVRWNGARWSIPNTIVSGLRGEPQRLSANYDGRGRIFLTWVDGEVGELFFSWASADRATISTEWLPAQSLSTKILTISSPDMLVDASGKILVVFAIPFNENRGIYFTVTEDLGNSWSDPVQIFDAQSANWDLIDHPKIDLASDGRLHLVFTRYSAQRQPIGLFYTQSSDGGTTWSELEEVRNGPVLWSEVISYDAQAVHRMWQEKRALLDVNYHQVSLDGGLTWGDLVQVSFTQGVSASPTLSMDPDGNIHFFQVTDPKSLTLQYSKWDGSRWINQEAVNLKISSDKSTVNFLNSNITPLGYLRAYLSVNSPDQFGEMQRRVITTRRLLEQSSGESNMIIGLIPEPVDNMDGTEEAALQVSPTVESPLANLSDPVPPMNRTVVGLLFVGVILVTLLGVGMYVIRRSRRNVSSDMETWI
jgi:hypothetical protein